MENKIKSFDGTKINYEISRSKTSSSFLIFIHGVGGDLTAWRKERYFFHKKGVSTIAIDLRGHGKSDRPDLAINYKLENFSKDIYQIIKKEKIKKFILVGHSFGGMVTIMFHKLFPSLAKSYILVDSTYKSPRRLKQFFKNHSFFKHILNHILENEDLRKKHFSHVKYQKYIGTGEYNLMRIFSDITHTSFKSWVFTYETLANFDGIKIIKSIKKRMLIIEGSKDTVINLIKAKKLIKLIKHSELKVIPDATHILVINNPKELETNIYNFIISLENFIKKNLKKN